MLRLTVELVPERDERRARVLCVGTITNVGAEGGRGDYRVELSPRDSPGLVELRGMVRGFNRRLGPWDLAFDALRATVGRRRRQEFLANQPNGAASAAPAPVRR